MHWYISGTPGPPWPFLAYLTRTLTTKLKGYSVILTTCFYGMNQYINNKSLFYIYKLDMICAFQCPKKSALVELNFLKIVKVGLHLEKTPKARPKIGYIFLPKANLPLKWVQGLQGSSGTPPSKSYLSTPPDQKMKKKTRHDCALCKRTS